MISDSSTFASTPGDSSPPVVTDSEQIYRQGLAYYDGNGVDKHYTWSAFRFLEAAQLGHHEAMARAGACFVHGIGFSIDLEQGLPLLRAAAEAGVASAQTDLADCYERGRGVEANWAEAERWYHAAARQDHVPALLALGYAYEKEKGPQCDPAQAEALWRRASDLGSDKAPFNLGVRCEKQNDWDGALRWFRLAAERGFVPGQIAVVDILSKGNDGLPDDSTESCEWTRRAAEAGDADGQYRLALNYYYGRGVPKSQALADQWVVLAGISGSASALQVMGTDNWNDVFQNAFLRFRDEAKKYVTNNPAVRMFDVDHVHVLVDYAQFSATLARSMEKDSAEPEDPKDDVPYLVAEWHLPREGKSRPVYAVYTNPDWVPAETPCMRIRTSDLVDRFHAAKEARGVWVNPWQHELSFTLEYEHMSVLAGLVDRSIDPPPMAILVKPRAQKD